MLVIDHQPPRTSRASRYTAFLIVILLHLLVFLWLALERAGVFPPELPVIEVSLFPGGGGGRPSDASEATETSARRAAPSAVHVPPVAVPEPDSPAAPPESAPQTLIPPLNPGLETVSQPDAAAATASLQGGGGAQAGQGGGVGAGSGTGTGDSIGAGDGPSRWLRTLTPAERDAHYPRDAAHRALSGRVVLNCVVYASTRIERCRVRSESPGGQGFGAAALQAVRLMRRQPPTVNGRVKSSHREDLIIYFTPPAAADAQPTR